MEKIILSGADGEDLEFFVLEETQLSGIKYLCDSYLAPSMRFS